MLKRFGDHQISQGMMRSTFQAIAETNNDNTGFGVQNQQSSDLGMATSNIKIAVSNRVKSAKQPKPSLIKVPSRAEQNGLNSRSTLLQQKIFTTATETNRATISPEKQLKPPQQYQINRNSSSQNFASQKHLLRPNSRRTGHESNFPAKLATNATGRRDFSNLESQNKKKFDTRISYSGSHQGQQHQYQRLWKGSNYSQLSQQRRLLSSAAANHALDALSGGQNFSSQQNQGDHLATNYTAAVSGVGARSNQNTAMIRESKAAHDYMGFNSIKSSLQKQSCHASLSISSDCVNAKRNKKLMRVQDSQSGIKLMMGSGEQDMKGLHNSQIPSQMQIRHGDKSFNQGEKDIVLQISLGSGSLSPTNKKARQSLQRLQTARRSDQLFKVVSQNQLNLNREGNRSPLSVSQLSSHDISNQQIYRYQGGQQTQYTQFYQDARRQQSRKSKLRRRKRQQDNEHLQVEKIQSTSTHQLLSSDNTVTPVKTSENHFERFLRASGGQNVGSYVDNSPDVQTATLGNNRSPLGVNVKVQQKYSIEKSEKRTTLIDLNNETENNAFQNKQHQNYNKIPKIEEAVINENKDLQRPVSSRQEIKQSVFEIDRKKFEQSNLHSEREPDLSANTFATAEPPKNTQNKFQMPYNSKLEALNHLNNFVNSNSIYEANQQTCYNNGDLSRMPVKQSIVLLQDQNGNLFKVNEDIFMRLQLEEMQKTVKRVAAKEMKAQRKSCHVPKRQPLSLANDNSNAEVQKALVDQENDTDPNFFGKGIWKNQQSYDKIQKRNKNKSKKHQKTKNQQRKNSSREHKKKASLVVNLTKPGQGRQYSPRRIHSSTTMRRLSSNDNGFQMSSTPKKHAFHAYQDYQSNAVHINGMRYEAINMDQRQNITQFDANCEASLKNPDLEVTNNNVKLKLESAATHAHSSENADTMSHINTLNQQAQFLDQIQSNLTPGGEKRSFMDMFQSEHNQFVKCMRNFGHGNLNTTGDLVIKKKKKKKNVQATESDKMIPSKRASGGADIDQVMQGTQVQLGSGELNISDTYINKFPLTPTQQDDNSLLYPAGIATNTSDALNHEIAPSQSQKIIQQAISDPKLVQSSESLQCKSNSQQIQSPNTVVSSPMHSRKTSNQHSRGISQNFPPQHLLTQNLDQGRIDRAFISPQNYMTGAKFQSKSEQNRFLKQFDQILKLKHILINDKGGDLNNLRKSQEQMSLEEAYSGHQVDQSATDSAQRQLGARRRRDRSQKNQAQFEVFLSKKNEKDRAKNYTRQLLASYFNEEELAQFSELGILNFQNTVKNLSAGPIEQDVKSFIYNAIKAASRSPIIEEQPNQQLGNQYHTAISNNFSGVLNSAPNQSNYVYNFEADSGYITSLGLNSGKRLHQDPRINKKQALQNTSKIQLQKPDSTNNRKIASSSIIESNSPNKTKNEKTPLDTYQQQINQEQKNNCLIHAQKNQPHYRNINNDICKSQTFKAFEMLDLNMRQPITPDGASKINADMMHHNQNLIQLTQMQLANPLPNKKQRSQQTASALVIDPSKSNQQLSMGNYGALKRRSEACKSNSSPQMRLATKNKTSDCGKLAKVEKVNFTVQPAKDIKQKKGECSQKYPEDTKKQIYYNPFNEGREIFVHRSDIPDLEPLYGDDKGEATYKVYDFINQQNLRLVKEIEPKSCTELNKEMNRDKTLLVSEIHNNNTRIKEIDNKHTREGIMRRNGLLLEHIIYDRCHKLASTYNYFQTPQNIEQLRNAYRPNLFWPNRDRKYPEIGSREIIGDELDISLCNLTQIQPQMPQNVKSNQKSKKQKKNRIGQHRSQSQLNNTRKF